MPLFTYRAIRADGTSTAGETTANDAGELRQDLEAKGYLVLELRQKMQGFGQRRINPKDFLLFNQEFSTLIKAGLPILQALEIVRKRAHGGAFLGVLDNIIHEIKGGTALSDAMAMHPNFFTPLYTATVRAGEKSGALPDVLRRFIVYQKQILAVRRKVKGALYYPFFLILATIAVLAIFTFYIIPNFTQMYSDQAGTLPLLTRMLIAVTEALAAYAPAIFLALIAAGAGVYLWQRTEKGRTVLDSLKVSIPFLKTLMIQYLFAQLTRTLATVLRGGIPLVQALDTTAGAISNKVVAAGLGSVRKLVTEGTGLAEALERTGLAPDLTVSMIEVGESSGELPQMLDDVADFYEQEVENRLTALTTMIEPVLMLSMGMIIALIVVALYLPIFEMGARMG